MPFYMGFTTKLVRRRPLFCTNLGPILPMIRQYFRFTWWASYLLLKLGLVAGQYSFKGGAINSSTGSSKRINFQVCNSNLPSPKSTTQTEPRYKAQHHVNIFTAFISFSSTIKDLIIGFEMTNNVIRKVIFSYLKHSPPHKHSLRLVTLRWVLLNLISEFVFFTKILVVSFEV